MTALELITQSLTDIGEAAQGETISSEDAAYGLDHLNQICESLSNDRLNIPFISTYNGTLSASLGTYTFGPSGTLVVATRPVVIQTASIVLSGISRSLEIISAPAWNEIDEQLLTGQLPLKLWPNGDFPNWTLNFWPRPSGTPGITINYWALIAGANLLLTDTLALPPGYLRALGVILTMELAPGYGRPVPDSIKQRYQDAYSLVRNKNLLDTQNATNPMLSPTRGDPPPQPGAQG